MSEPPSDGQPAPTTDSTIVDYTALFIVTSLAVVLIVLACRQHKTLSAGGLVLISYSAVLAAPELVRRGGPLRLVASAYHLHRRLSRQDSKKLENLVRWLTAALWIELFLTVVALAVCVAFIANSGGLTTDGRVLAVLLSGLAFQLLALSSYLTWLARGVTKSLCSPDFDEADIPEAGIQPRWALAVVVLVTGVAMQYVDLMRAGG